MAPSPARPFLTLLLLSARLPPSSHQRPFLSLPTRLLSTPTSSSPTPQPPDYLNAKELAVFEKLRRELRPEKLEVQDISGGCGSMYAIEIVSTRFRGLSVIRQHRLVNGVLGEEIREWHGVQLRTGAC